MIDDDDVKSFYKIRMLSEPIGTHLEMPHWVSSKTQEKLFLAIEICYQRCKQNINGINQSSLKRTLKRDVIIQGTTICKVAGVNRKALTPAKQPQITDEIKKRNSKLSDLLIEKEKSIKVKKPLSKTELTKEIKELKNIIKSIEEKSLRNYFKEFENSEWANSLESVYEKLKQARAKIIGLEKENANLRYRNDQLSLALERLNQKT